MENEGCSHGTLTLSMREYAKEKVADIIQTLEEFSISPYLAIVFGSAIRGKQLPPWPRCLCQPPGLTGLFTTPWRSRSFIRKGGMTYY